jgi:hypothetical protein
MNPASPGSFIARFFGLSLLGLVCLSLGGLVAALLLPFLVGYGVYALYRYFAKGQTPQVKEEIVVPVKKVAEVTYQGSHQVAGGLMSVLRVVTRSAAWLISTIIGGGWMMATEILGGAILGAALGVMIGLPTNTDRFLVMAGAGGGALLGMLNGIGTIRSRRRMAQLKKLELAVARS